MTQEALRLDDRDLERLDRVAGGTRATDRRGQADLGRVIDHDQDPPRPMPGRLELGEVDLPHPVAARRWLEEDLLTTRRERPPLGEVATWLEQVGAAHRPLDR